MLDSLKLDLVLQMQVPDSLKLDLVPQVLRVLQALPVPLVLHLAQLPDQVLALVLGSLLDPYFYSFQNILIF